MTKIITLPNPLLREKSKPVEIDKKVLELAANLKKTLTDKKGGVLGVGLAAIQIGIPKKVFVAYSQGSKKFLTFINPEIVWQSKKVGNGVEGSKSKYEGCLSVPNKWALVHRPKAVRIKYQSESGQTQTRKFSGQLATIVQHEYDHLNGILFVDRVLEQKGKLYELKENEEGKESLEEIKP